MAALKIKPMIKAKLKPFVYVHLAVSIFSGVLAQLFMKYGVNGLESNIHLTAAGGITSDIISLALLFKIIKILFIVFTGKFVLIGIVLYLISMFFWINVLSKIDLSVAYPFVSIGVILTVILAAVTLHESIPPLRWAGILVTLSGVYLTVSSHRQHKDNGKGGSGAQG